MIDVFALTNITTKTSEGKLSKFLFQKCVYESGSPSDESVPRSCSQFQKGWWSLVLRVFAAVNPF